MLEAATDIAASAAEAPVSTGEPPKTVEPRSAGVSTTRPDLDEALIDMQANHYGYQANLQVMKTSDEAFADLLERVVPPGGETD